MRHHVFCTHIHTKWRLQEQPVNLWCLPEDAGLIETKIDICSEIAKILKYSFCLPLTIYDWLLHLYLQKTKKKDYWEKSTYKFWTSKELAIKFLKKFNLFTWLNGSWKRKSLLMIFVLNAKLYLWCFLKWSNVSILHTNYGFKMLDVFTFLITKFLSNTKK